MWANGDRLEVEGSRGTVRYVGTIDNVRGDWLGVDWDDPSRGKHDGSHKGIVYFRASQSSSGSFLRIEKACKGSGLLQAVKERYGGHDPSEESFLGHKTHGMASKEILFVGMDHIESKQRDVSRLRCAVVDGMAVAEAGEEVGSMSSLQELDVSANLFSDWAEIFRLISGLPSLSILNISRNLMKPWPEDELRLKGSRDGRMKEILANSCGLETAHWSGLIERFENLESLSLSGNNIQQLPLSSRLTSLSSLDLSLNPIGSWEEVARLGLLPGLATLNVMSCGIKSISSIMDGHFPSLHSLFLNGNKISSWTSVYALGKLGSLRCLVLEPNPVLAADFRTTSRQLVLAELPKLKVLDREEVTAKEVRGAEIDYLKKFGKAWLAAEGNQEAVAQFVSEHPRYADLVDRYGAPEAVEMEMETKKTGGILSTTLLDITFVHGDKQFQKSLPPSMMVKSLVPLVKRLFKLPPRSKLEFSAEYATRPGVEVPLDNHERELAFFSLQAGDVVKVSLAKA